MRRTSTSPRILVFIALPMAVLLGISFAGGCAGHGAGFERWFTPDPPYTEERVSYYRGLVRVHTPEEARLVAEYPALVKRTLKPLERRVVEEFITSTPDGVEERVVTYDLAGETCVIEDPGGAAAGACEMIGDPWNWHAWRSTTTLIVQGERWTVVREDLLTEWGIRARRSLTAADGTPGPVLDETYVSVAPAEFEALRLKALRKP